MFYSHEILTSRKYGVATVWLVATLGAKSNTKKVTRKAILEVDVQKACETIIQPEAPMALRLQSNLLYGVSRVYDQQCNYVLSDAQAAQNNMRALLRVAKENDIDAAPAKTRPDQLLLMDDPAFNIDMALPALDFDFSNLGIELAGDSQGSTQSMLSIPRDRSGSVSSSRGFILGINLPSSSRQSATYQLPMNDPFTESSGQKPFGIGGIGRDIFDDEGELFQDDMIFEFDADGQMRDIDIDEREARRAGSILPNAHLGSDSAASGRVRKEHEDAIAGRILPVIGGEDDFDMVNFGDDDLHLSDAEPFPMMSGALGGNDRPQPHLVSEDRVFSQGLSSESAEAPQKKRKTKAPKKLAADLDTALRNNDLLTWQREYKDNMTAGRLLNVNKKAKAQTKKNAFFFVYGSGLNGVGNGVGSKIPSPLAMFSGEALLAKIAGREIAPKAKKTSKRARDAEEEEEESIKRVRQEESQHEDEIGRGNFDDDLGMIMEDESTGMEIGREAQSALQDYPSSAIMPWNVSASVHSHQRAGSSSIQGRANSQIGHRLTSASPLIGRGSNLPGDLDHMIKDDQILYGREDDFQLDDDANLFRSQGHNVSPSQAEFDIFGPAAQVDTQTAATSQWVREALDHESNNFFEYVRNTVAEKVGDEVDNLDELEGDLDRKYVTFEELFDVKKNTRMVAAQAFYHVLSLATKRRVWVEQDEGEDIEPFGEIRIGVLP